MDSMNLKRAGSVIPGKGSRFSGISKNLENLNPNVSSPGLEFSNSPLVKSAKCTKASFREPKLRAFAEEQDSREERRRARLLVEARKSVPDRGAGRVMHLIQAFEKLLDSKIKRFRGKRRPRLEETKKGLKWALPGLQKPTEVPES
ncbi:uncharacterized protein LOC111396949 isoform X1 [Olea europaea subsp. europaea]|uniref:Uncharacterized protein LOC111396949 isoform X1 n=1 Tax=Olea europaea subsp. europaea TaxID=158383 RepID=A0A8S0RZ81_OLEEU|nr:uncharacterized protein LOC111396949 isoform X1 [Olea europaea subsp. europaea]